MNAVVIAIGDEITTGQRLDTNSQWLSQQLVGMGIRTAMHLTVPDDLELCVQAFQIAGFAELAVVTGGLGPTADDLTRDAIAKATACPPPPRVPSIRVLPAAGCSQWTTSSSITGT